MGLWERRHYPVGAYFKGMKQKVAIARTLVHQPPLVFLDEPTSGLDPQATHLIRDFIAQLRDEGRTVPPRTHLLSEAERLCDRVAVYKRTLIAVDTPRSLRQSRQQAKVVVTLTARNDALIGGGARPAVRARSSGMAAAPAAHLTDPSRQTPDLIRRLVEGGAEIRGVREEQPSLEHVYLSLTGSLRLE